MLPVRYLLLSLLLFTPLAVSPALAAHKPAGWSFAASGDSRNCGNLVMPAIAAAVQADGDRFYWHLGDLRRIRGVDEDYVRESRYANSVPTLADYWTGAWSDFLVHQVRPFGSTPFFLGIGNHETIEPKTREEFRTTFATLLNRNELARQRRADAAPSTPGMPPPTYYHWVIDGVDFINLDNATADSFDAEQLRWFDGIVARDLHDRHIRTLVVGMHEALPHSLAAGHSMCASDGGIQSGEHVYARLIDARKRGKRVYILASHSHYYLENLYATDYWRDPRHGGVVLPGWIVGTAGAVRYPLPIEVIPGPGARAHVYGYLAGLVGVDGAIDFRFHELAEADLQRALPGDYTPRDAEFCFVENPPFDRMGTSAPAPACLVQGQDNQVRRRTHPEQLTLGDHEDDRLRDTRNERHGPRGGFL